MSIFEKLFGNTASQQPAAPQNQQAQQQPQPGNLPATPVATTAPQGTAGNINAAGTNEVANTAASPLDEFKGLWETSATDNKEDQPIGFNVDPQKLMEAASKVDFTKVIKPEDMAAITAGGEGAAQAFMRVINSVTQNSYAQSALATSKIVEAALAQAQEKFEAKIPSYIKKQNLSNSLREENPALSHPAAAPILTAIESQLTVKYPSATGAEIKKMATDYLTSFATAVTPKKSEETTGGKGGKTEMDWSTFLE